MNNNILKSFLIGASPFLFIPFQIIASSIKENTINFKTYAIKASLYFGSLNAFFTYLGEKYSWSLTERLRYASITSIFLIFAIIVIAHPYQYKTSERWFLHFIMVAIGHTIAFTVIIYYLEKQFNTK